MSPIPEPALTMIRRYRTCEFTTLSKSGTPITWPVSSRLLDDGRFLLTTMIGFPQKAFNVRRNPKVSLLFSEPKGSGVKAEGAVLVQGNAVCEDRIVSDVSTVPELEAYLVENIFARQPAGKMWSTWLGRRVLPMYYMRLLVYVTPTWMTYWPSRDFSRSPQEIEVSHVG